AGGRAFGIARRLLPSTPRAAVRARRYAYPDDRLSAATSQQSVLREGKAQSVADDEVIEHVVVHQAEGLLEPPRDELVRLARFEHSGGMVVREDHRRRIVQQRLAQHLAGMHSGAVDGAAKQLLEGDEPVPVVEVQAAEDFVRPVT